MQAQPNTKIPAVFVSHGSPMVALESGPYQDAITAFGRQVRPRAIVAISAHWGSSMAVSISAAEKYETIHDFGGFPRALYELTYSPPGSPGLAQGIARLLASRGCEHEIVNDRGLDHGVWVPLRLMYPAADIPVVQLSVPLQLTPEQLYKIGEALRPLRAEGVMIFGSGGIVHNLFLFRGGAADQPVVPWAAEFDSWFAEKLEEADLAALLDYEKLAPHAEEAVPTFEHLAPVFIVLGAATGNVEPIFEGFQYGSISLRSFAIA